MKFRPGDKVKIECYILGTVMNDPTNSEMSIVVDFDGQLARFPNDGTLLGLKCLKLTKVEEVDGS